MASSPDLTVLVMGETGSGKSSVVNLLAGENVAEVSSGVNVCTAKTIRHEATIEGQAARMEVDIWEVGGFNQPEAKPGKNFEMSFDVELGPILQANAKVDVILFCMQGPKLKMTTTRIFEYVNNIFGGRVTVVPVITNLERERENMENWWDRNGERVRNMGLGGTEHACITGLQGARYETKSAESRTSLVSILEGQCSSNQDSISLEFALREHVRQDGGYSKKMLMKRFKVDAATAKRLL
ncbi:hypothetical protein EDC04DRAFT_778123 [Pisolithus marmoratus]|nr:hypothetical protein EDC04DRAFT_778123 [Pisolithus marmoratus]